MTTDDGRHRVGVTGRELTVSSLDRVVYPSTSTTKAEVLRYYLAVADVMLPHLAGRPVTLRRYPDGVEQAGFFQKRCPSPHPDWIDTVAVPRSGDAEPLAQCVLTDAAGLAWATNLGTVEFHVPLSRTPELDVPTSIVFDLDPGPPAGLLDAVWLALQLRRTLDVLGLVAVAKTSGGKGVHVVVPLDDPTLGFQRTRDVARILAGELARAFPDRVVTTQTRAVRRGRVLVDWTQNHPTKTTVSAYSLRAGPRPTVSTPVTWDELEHADSTGDVAALRFGPAAVVERIAAHGDLFAAAVATAQRLPDVVGSDLD